MSGTTRATIPQSDIRWTLAPVDRIEHTDPLTLTETELLAYCADLQSEMGWLRSLLHESLSHVAKLTDDLKRSARVVEFQRRQLREQCEQLAALAA